MNYFAIENDITEMQTDAIVLPANSALCEGSGTSAAIYEKAGRKELRKACVQYGKVPVGMSVPTLGYNLDAKYIIHTVVPKWTDGKHNEYGLLSAAYLSALTMADDIGCTSISFPLLASGNNGFDLKTAFEIADSSVHSYEPSNHLEKVYLVLYGMRVVKMVKKMDIPVEEKIDQAYVLSKDERYKNDLERSAEYSAQKAKELASLAKEWLKVKDHQQIVMKVGMQIADIVLTGKAKTIAGVIEVAGNLKFKKN